jgi:hypothetical protein
MMKKKLLALMVMRIMLLATAVPAFALGRVVPINFCNLVGC